MNPESHHPSQRSRAGAGGPTRRPASAAPTRGLVLGCMLAAGLLAGCAAPPAVSAPAQPATAASSATIDGPSARLLLRGSVPVGDQIAVFKLADAVACKGPSLLTAGTQQKPPAPVELPAGVLTTLDFVIIRAGKPGCGVRWSFTPAAGKTYLLLGLAVGSGCRARLVDASVPDRLVLPPDAALRSASGQTCLPLAQARAAARPNAALIQGGQHQGEAVLNPQATTEALQGLIGR